ncbi:hypothetical protein [Olsenella sp. An290]|uniref:hypothetical protein n=1 Tax=Olsenella sp. An290 TaxID=1965625 RepID=UPI000B3AFB32|nr:hypothetical protein [Olsenella sp. An290]
MMRVEKTVWNSMKAIGGFVVGAVTVFGWLNVTPEMVGQTTYDAMRGPAPLVVMFVSGSLFGWGVTKLWSDRRMKEASEAHDAAVAKRISSGLDDMSGFEHVDDLDALIKKARGLSTLQRQLAARDAEIESLETELAGRPAQEDVGELKRQLAAKDAEIESLRSPVESVRRTMASLPEGERALAGRLAKGPFRTSGFSAEFAHLESVGVAKRQRVPGVFTPTWALTREAMSALSEDDGLMATVADALGRGLRDRSAEEAVASAIRRAPAATAGAISLMFDEGHFDYRAPDDDPWEARVDQGNRDLSEMESDGVIRYETLASGNRRWTLTENARRAIKSDESLISEGRAYVRAALEDGADEDEESA